MFAMQVKRRRPARAFVVAAVLGIAGSAFGAFGGSAFAGGPVPIIFDTDIMSDVDDVGAVAALHALADGGEARILAMGVCVKNAWSPLCLDALNTYFQRADIPLGVVKGPAHTGASKYAQGIAEEFPHALKSADDAPDAVLVYRKVLASQPDHSVVMVSVGQLTNLRNLLKSGPDSSTSLDGVELVKTKVRAWVCMGGIFPKGQEFNLVKDGPAARYTVEHWPTPVVFSGWEIGDQIMTGARLAEVPKQSPVRRAYELYNGLHNRQSWDQTAVLYAVRGLDGGLADYWLRQSDGTLHVKPDGGDTWYSSTSQGQSYLVRKMAPEKIAAVIESLMLHAPGT
ncbi:MAG TPA: nucleoside hydrolase [Pirellulales bacterium]|jgi:inosine-uridine nucleoside N-ribohydrolase|nr:nucleoside hydrolase [Pirellulales bacterium]